MPAPIPFSVAQAVRSGEFSSSVMSYPGGYSMMEWFLDGLGSGSASAYENPNNSFAATVMYEPPLQSGQGFTIYDESTWTGRSGGNFNHNGVYDSPQAMAIGLGGVLSGSSLFVDVFISGTYNVGISSGLIT